MEEADFVKKKQEDREVLKRWLGAVLGDSIKSMVDSPSWTGVADVEVVLKNGRHVWFKVQTITEKNATQLCPRYSVSRKMRLEMEKMRRKKRTESIFAFRKWDVSYGKSPKELEDFWLADFADFKYDEWERPGSSYALISVELIKQAHPKVLEEVEKKAALPK